MSAHNPTHTDWRIIGVSGDTCDGREISAQELTQMAEGYDPEIYGARINLEHFRFLFPEWGGAYGDVIALKAEPWPKDPSRTALYARLAVLPALQELWDKGEKVYTSMEIDPRFAGTGKAYLVGLAITNSPASLGTTKNFNLAAAKARADGQTVFSQYREDSPMNTDPIKHTPPAEAAAVQADTVAEDKIESLFTRLFDKFFGKNEPAAQDETPPADDDTAGQIRRLSQAQADAARLYEATLTELRELAAKHTELEQAHAQLLARLETEPAAGQRKEHSGAEQATVGW